MMNRLAAGTGLARTGCTWLCLPLLATIAGCRDVEGPPPVAALVRPVKILVVSAPDRDADFELPGRVRAAGQVDLAFDEVSGQIVELPFAERERQGVLKGELLAQIDSEPFETALRSAEIDLGGAYSALDLARAENERMEKMKGVNPDLVSDSMLERTRQKLEQTETRLDSLEAAVQRAENLLENTSLRAPFAGVVTRHLVKSLQTVQAGEPILSLRGTDYQEILIDLPVATKTAGPNPGPDHFSAFARFPSAPGESFPLGLKEVAPTADPGTGTYRLVLEMPKPKGIDLPPGSTGTVRIASEGSGERASPILVPAIAVMTDPDGKDYVWLVEETELRARRRAVRIGRLVGSDQVQILSGLAGGEKIVVAGVMQLAEGRRVRLWEEQETGKGQ